MATDPRTPHTRERFEGPDRRGPGRIPERPHGPIRGGIPEKDWERQRERNRRREEAQDVFESLEQTYPWLAQLGFSLRWIQRVVAGASSPEEIVAEIRNSKQYAARFVAIRRPDGSLRMNEGQYLQLEQGYREVLAEFGLADPRRTGPADFVGFVEGEIDPNELRDRLQIYRNVQRGGRHVKEAFYLYAGLELKDDDLYEAIVDPAAAQGLATSFNNARAQSPLDRKTWLKRATKLGLDRVVDGLKASGSMTNAQAIQYIMGINRNFAERMMDAIYSNGGDPNSRGTLSHDELISAFENAMIGAAASRAGLAMPTKERILQFRSAGVNAARANEVYRELAMNSGIYRAAVQRARGTKFGVQQGENAFLLNDPKAMKELQAGLAGEEAAGHAVGGFGFERDDFGRIRQGGLTA